MKAHTLIPYPFTPQLFHEHPQHAKHCAVNNMVKTADVVPAFRETWLKVALWKNCYLLPVTSPLQWQNLKGEQPQAGDISQPH